MRVNTDACLFTHTANTVLFFYIHKHFHLHTTDTQTHINMLLHPRSANFFFFFWTLHRGANPNKSRARGCFQKWTWHLLNQIEIKIVKYEPNLCNPLVVFSQIFELLEGCSVFPQTSRHRCAHPLKLIRSTTVCCSVQIVTYRCSY